MDMDKEQLDREIAQVTCETCGATFETQRELDEHTQTEHEGAITGLPSQQGTAHSG